MWRCGEWWVKRGSRGGGGGVVVGGGGGGGCFFFNDTATTEIYTLSLHDALPILLRQHPRFLYCPFLVAAARGLFIVTNSRCGSAPSFYPAHFSLWQHPRFLYCPYLVAAAPRFLYCPRSEEHTSELQSPDHLVCRLLLEKKKKNKQKHK